MIAAQSKVPDPIHITADSWQYNRKTGVSIFTGDPVNVTQGQAHLEATKVVTKQTDDKHIEDMTAFGNGAKQAHYWNTESSKNKPALHAHADTIHYAPKQTLVTLKDHGHIQQGNNHFNGHLIYYNIQDETITAPKTPNSRTTIIYQPD